MDIEWGSPPARHMRSGHNPLIAQFFQALRERPGEWAVWPFGQANSNITRLNRGIYHGINHPGEFLATSSTVNGVKKIYVRYVNDA